MQSCRCQRPVRSRGSDVLVRWATRWRGNMQSRKLPLGNAVASGGMAVSFCASAAAADLMRGPTPPRIAPIPTWAGFYIGGHFGGVTSNETVDFASTDPSGVLGGLQAGYNYIVAPNWLVGIEGELSWTSTNGTNIDGVKSQHKWYDTLDARLGYMMGSSLLSAKVGAAWMKAEYSVPRFLVSETG